MDHLSVLSVVHRSTPQRRIISDDRCRETACRVTKIYFCVCSWDGEFCIGLGVGWCVELVGASLYDLWNELPSRMSREGQRLDQIEVKATKEVVSSLAVSAASRSSPHERVPKSTAVFNVQTTITKRPLERRCNTSKSQNLYGKLGKFLYSSFENFTVFGASANQRLSHGPPQCLECCT